jgi:CheY-like chemotaxis protein
MRDHIGQALRLLATDIDQTHARLGTEIDPLDLVPIHRQLLAGAVPGVGARWQTGWRHEIATRQIENHKLDEALMELILQSGIHFAFLFASLEHGTGLGLSMIYGFARQTGGHASIHSIPGEGTTVNIYLPCNLTSLTAPVTRQQSVARSPQGSGETILFVEDEPGVRLVLAELGYVTHEAIDASSALAMEGELDRLDLLITDVGLPGTNGRQLAEMLRQRRPNLKLLFITGYANKATVRGEFLGEGMDMLAKPFTIDALAHKVKDMIRL